MTSSQHQLWISRGRPFTLARPLAALRDKLRVAGYTVYDIGNTEHLDHQPPEDHTPFSETGWPGTSPYGVGMAIDIMPPRAGSGLPSLQVLGRRLFDDRQAGRAPFIKYMNWGPVSDRAAVQDRWMPGYVRRASSDAGHIHISCRTDHATSAAADGYDPLGEDIMATASQIIEAWSQGMPKTPDGRVVAPVDWRIRDEAWQRSTTTALTAAAADAKAGRLAIEALAAAVNAGGGSVDSAAIIAHVDQLAAAERDRELQLLAEIADLQTELAAARAAVEAQLSPAERAALPSAG